MKRFWQLLTRRAERSSNVIVGYGPEPPDCEPMSRECLERILDISAPHDPELSEETEAFIRGIVRSVFAKP